MPVRWKLFATLLLMMLVMGGTSYAYLRRTLEQDLLADLRLKLRGEATLAAQLAQRDERSLRVAGPELADLIGNRLGVRATLIASDGSVVGDSEVAAIDLGALDNHGNRPEVQAALADGHGMALRYSETLRREMLYVATRIVAERPEGGVVRLAVPLIAIEQAKSGLVASLTLALLLVVGLSLFLTQLAGRKIQALSEGVERFGAGDFRRRLPVESRDEFGTLAQTMNAMAERLQMQMAHLTAERGRLDAILRGMGEGLLVTDHDGTVRLTNPAFRELFGVDDGALGRPLQELSRHPLLASTFRNVVENRCEQVAELTLPGSDGRVLLTHWVPLREGGEQTGVVTVFHDITDIKRLERVRRDFVANVSHELRTPISVIRGYAETLVGGLIESDPATATRFAAIIQSHADRLTSLIADLLTLSALEGSGNALDLEPLPLPPLAAHCCALLAKKAEERGVVFDCDGVADWTVIAHRGRLEQVLFNLFDNAIKHAPSGSSVKLAARADGDLIEVSVADRGTGIPPEALPRLFERFYRVDAGRSRDQGGTGLGLAIVKHIVQLHGGRVWIESTPGQGTTVYFTLRRHPETI
ncbi:MAG: hypothetical protein A2091_13195 [Desulfuromonadales bacterium GWD2_61_12]|nr:MAG: hypothetical protein A2005_03705 [Desulfuromonadales bacterium GWC2_61_20]OGR35493.1 MAG: hypothetical protein A2091_13195 [Desulfuromonadales bacterium GWD2_61_12]HAD04588.1 PAS domain-containing sensor histidine kinase [Desulfuromonas sp.]HBT83177.1 PAS domain-containing sensor histidine kinase [Desulfuromonas sp.]